MQTQTQSEKKKKRKHVIFDEKLKNLWAQHMHMCICAPVCIICTYKKKLNALLTDKQMKWGRSEFVFFFFLFTQICNCRFSLFIMKLVPFDVFIVFSQS